MTLLSPSVLPVVPSAFMPGDRITVGSCTVVRLASGVWECSTCKDDPISVDDATIRDLFVSPSRLTELGRVPMVAPAEVPADAPLPGRPVLSGEKPFEPGRTYLVCSTGVGTGLAGVRGGSGPWGAVQAALVPAHGGPSCGEHFEVSLAETGTVFMRCAEGGVTFAFIPAEQPTETESHALMTYAAVLALCDLSTYVVVL
ncbi:hypothetical protein [Streptomyces sp. NPDC088707]|uniref:hypothetical protein n=1 Tax=Streptomyces sp. NPDC088707 TaxID=3365871 RepID=UPI0038213F37